MSEVKRSSKGNVTLLDLSSLSLEAVLVVLHRFRHAAGDLFHQIAQAVHRSIVLLKDHVLDCMSNTFFPPFFIFFLFFLLVMVLDLSDFRMRPHGWSSHPSRRVVASPFKHSS